MTVSEHLFGAARSLRRRLVVNISIALTLCVAIAGLILVHEFYEHLEETIDEDLFQEAQEVLGQVDPDAPNFGLNPDALRFRGIEGIYRYTVFDATGQAVVGGEASAGIWAQLSQAGLGEKVDVRLPGDRIGVGLRAMVRNTDVFVLASTFPRGTEQTQIQKLLHEIEEGIWWVVLGLGIILTAAVLATRRALASLDIVSLQAHGVGPFEIDKRLSVHEVPTEIQPLIRAVNGAFDRLEHGYQAQRDFSSNVAHEIRTPLAVLRSSVDRIQDAELQESLAGDLSRLDQIFEQLIDLSRADASRGNTFGPVNLRTIVMEQAHALASEALQAGRTLGVNGSVDGQVDGHAGLLGIALKNIVRNALRYAPEGSEVEIEVTQNPLGIRVLDTGPGVPDALKDGLFDRFNRGKASHESNGSGIGLAIVQSVARAHGAKASVSDRPGGGSIFAITWPDKTDT
jgi:signal transduction histidine kinase